VAQRVGRGIALLFHDRGTRRGWVVSSTPWPHFTPGKDPVPILQEAGWAPGLVWTGGKSRPHRDSIPDRPVCSQLLYRLSYPSHTKGRGIALLFHDRGTRGGVSGQQHAPAALYPQERPGTHITGGWVGPGAGLDRQKISSPPGFDPGPVMWKPKCNC